MLRFPAHLLAAIPIPPALIIEVAELNSTAVLDFRKRAAWRWKPKARPVFEIAEIEVLIEAAENGRIRPQDFLL